MLWLWIALGAVVLVVLVVFAVGALLPRGHTATCSATLRVPPERVFEAITDWRAIPKWRKEVTAVEPLPDGNGWIETSRFGRLPLRVEVSEPPRLFRGRIADPKLPFGGTWTWRLVPAMGGWTRVSVTEDGTIGPPPFRFLARFVFGYHATLRSVLRSLAAKFGDTVEILES